MSAEQSAAQKEARGTEHRSPKVINYNIERGKIMEKVSECIYCIHIFSYFIEYIDMHLYICEMEDEVFLGTKCYRLHTFVHTWYWIDLLKFTISFGVLFGSIIIIIVDDYIIDLK